MTGRKMISLRLSPETLDKFETWRRRKYGDLAPSQNSLLEDLIRRALDEELRAMPAEKGPDEA